MAMDEVSGSRRGIAFPPRIDVYGRLACSEGPENVRESIRIILLTNRRERVKLPTFGAGLSDYLFEPNTASTRRQIQDSISRSLERWEPRIEVLSIAVDADPHDPHAVIATVHYRALGSALQDSLSMQLTLTGE